MRGQLLSTGKRIDGRTLRGYQADHVRGVGPSEDPRLRHIHEGRDAGPGGHDLRHLRGRAEDRVDPRRGELQVLHAPLQLPALQRGRGQLLEGAVETRDRPRPPRRAGAFADTAAKGRFPLHDTRRLGDTRIERLVLDGLRLRRVPLPDGRRRPGQGAGRQASRWGFS